METWPLLNLSCGPAEVTPRTLRDGARPVLYHYDPAFLRLFTRTCALLQEVYRTQYDVVIMQGEAVLGLEAAAASLIAPGDKVLNLVSGVFGQLYAPYIERYGGEVVELAVPFDEAIDPDDVRAALRRTPGITYLSMVHSETPSGTVNPVCEIGAIAREFGVLTIVDTVSGLGSEPFSPEECAVDVAISAPQKCLGGTPGLSLLAISPAAWETMEQRPRPLRGSFLSILDWRESWIAQGRFPYTPSVSTVYALESALTQVLEVGLERHVARHAAVARACRAGVRALGLRPWPARDEIAAACCTAVAVPDNLDEAALRDRMRGRYGVMISGGHGGLAGKVFRLGHMGPAAQPAYLAAQLGVLERALADLGWPVLFGAGVGAAMAALDSWS